MDVRVGPKRRLNTEELMLLNWGAREDSWEPLGLQRDQPSGSYRKLILNCHLKGWCWSWSSNTLATWCEEPIHWRRPWCWEKWRQEEKGTAEDEMAGWHHWLNGCEFEQTPGDGERQGSLACCSPWESQRVGYDLVSSVNHFALLHFLFLGMVLITASCTMLWISIHSSSDTIRAIRANPLNLFVTSSL